MEVYLVGTLVVIVVYLLWRRKQKYANFPPGPRGWPIFGNIFDLGDRPHVSLVKWAEQYGDIFSISLFGRRIVVVNSYALIYDGLVQRYNDFSGRPFLTRGKLLFGNAPHVSFDSPNTRWKQLKRMSMTSLKMYGANLQVLEDVSLDILQELVEKWEGCADKAVDIRPDLMLLIGSITMSIVFGKKLDDTSMTKILRFVSTAERVIMPGGKGEELDIFPWLRYLGNKAYKELDESQAKFGIDLGQEIEQRRASYEPGNSGCVLDALFNHQNKDMDEEGKPVPSNPSLNALVREYMIGGINSTTSALYTYFAILALNPATQQRLHDEVSSVLGQRLPRLADRGKMPYLEASLLETLRYASLVPTGLPHNTMVDTTLGGYTLPKSTEVWFNLWYLHHDEKLWEDPWTFKVERFLDGEGKLLPVDHEHRKRLMPFGAGQRVCLGEVLARNRLFLISAMLLQRFRFDLAEGEQKPRVDPREQILKIVLVMPTYKLKIAQRTAS